MEMLCKFMKINRNGFKGNVMEFNGNVVEKRYKLIELIENAVINC